MKTMHKKILLALSITAFCLATKAQTSENQHQLLQNKIETAMENGQNAEAIGYAKQDAALWMQEKGKKSNGYLDAIELLSIIYLLSDAAAWVTGTSLVVDGGRLLK